MAHAFKKKIQDKADLGMRTRNTKVKKNAKGLPRKQHKLALLMMVTVQGGLNPMKSY